MRQIAALAALMCLAGPPLAAQTPPEGQDGFDLMEEGANLLLRGLMDEMAPALDQFGAMAQQIGPAFDELTAQMGPALAALLDRIDSIRYYEAPVILDNGDILIRRSPDAPAYVARPSHTSPPRNPPVMATTPPTP